VVLVCIITDVLDRFLFLCYWVCCKLWCGCILNVCGFCSWVVVCFLFLHEMGVVVCLGVCCVCGFVCCVVL